MLATATQPHVEVIVGETDVPVSLNGAFRRLSATASFASLRDATRRAYTPAADAVVIIAEANNLAAAELRAIVGTAAARQCGTLVLCAHQTTPNAFDAPEGAPVLVCDPASEEELTIRLRTIIELRPALTRLHELSTPRALREDEADGIRRQLRSVGQLQREFLPNALPAVDGLAFRALYRPANFVSGDIYDVRQLDGEHVAISIADAQGNGLISAMLTVFLKRALLGRERHGAGYRLLDPVDVLARLNEELIESALPECPFVAATYALLNVKTREFVVARAGAPLPIVRKAGGRSVLMRASGPPAGVFADAKFEAASCVLEPGDAALICSDGVAQLVCDREVNSSADQRKSAQSDAIVGTAWFEQLRVAGVRPALEQLGYRHDSLRRLGHTVDDLTALAVLST